MNAFNDQVKEIKFAWEPLRELTEEEIEEILKENHELIGHPGIQKTYDRISEQYRIPNLMERIKERIKNCENVLKRKIDKDTR